MEDVDNIYQAVFVVVCSCIIHDILLCSPCDILGTVIHIYDNERPLFSTTRNVPDAAAISNSNIGRPGDVMTTAMTKGMTSGLVVSGHMITEQSCINGGRILV